MRFSGRPLALLLSAASTSAFVARPTFARSSSSFSSGTKQQMMARVALCQFPVTEDKAINHATASDYLQRAADAGAQLAVLPEIWNSPYATSAFEEFAEVLPSVGDDSSSSPSPSAQLLQQHAKDSSMWVVGGSIPENDNGKIYNTCLIYDPSGSLVAKHRKVHLFDIDVPGGIRFKESDTLCAGEGMTAFDGGEAFGMIGVGICYDIRFPEYALLLGKKHQCNILIYPGAFNMTTGPAHWELLQRARAVDNQCYVLTASPARVEETSSSSSSSSSKYPHYTAWGHSMVVAPWGTIDATADEKEALVICDLDLEKVHSMRQSIPTAQQKRSDLYELNEP